MREQIYALLIRISNFEPLMKTAPPPWRPRRPWINTQFIASKRIDCLTCRAALIIISLAYKNRTGTRPAPRPRPRKTNTALESRSYWEAIRNVMDNRVGTSSLPNVVIIESLSGRAAHVALRADSLTNAAEPQCFITTRRKQKNAQARQLGGNAFRQQVRLHPMSCEEL